VTFLYQIFIQLFNFIVPVAALFSPKEKLFVRGRKNIFHELKQRITDLKTQDFRLIWFHCASLGEFEQARPLIEQYKVQSTKCKILITFFSSSGYEIRKNYDGADFIFYLPIDTRSNVKKFLDTVKPSQVFFVKYDFWYNYLSELNKRNIPTYLVSANFREEQFKGIYGKYLRKVLPFFKHIFVQNEPSQKMLAGNKISNVTVSGDLRYDRVSETVLKAKKIATIEHFTSLPGEKGAKAKVMVCGSTWTKDEEIISSIQLPAGNWKLIIAPHEINEEHIQKIQDVFKGSLRYSVVSKESATTALDKLETAQVLIIDNIGMLSNLYQYADIAYIGGGFGSGIHNILEAVAFGAPVIFGPNHHKFPEASEIIKQGGGFSVSDTGDLQKTMDLLLSDAMVLKMASMTCKNLVQSRKGATERILMQIAI